MKKLPDTKPSTERQAPAGIPAPRPHPRASSDVPAPTLAQARARVRAKPGFFASLGAEALAAIVEHGGPSAIGPTARKR